MFSIEVSRANYQGPQRYVQASIRQAQVIYALILHDIKSRFFGSGLGYAVTIIWPSVHIAIIVGIFYFTNRPAPYGNDRLLYACLGSLPYIIWNYISRFTHMGVLGNKNFLQYPVVKPLDLMVSRQILEIVSCSIIIILMIVFLTCCGVDFYPHRPAEACFALMSAALLGIGFGVAGGVIVMIFPLFNVLYFGILIGFWFSAGLVINPEEMPDSISNLFAWVPLLHSIEWLRFAYYDEYPARLLDRSYVLIWGGGSLAFGLALERVLRLFTMR